jgi:hypothetical protein
MSSAHEHLADLVLASPEDEQLLHTHTHPRRRLRTRSNRWWSDINGFELAVAILVGCALTAVGVTLGPLGGLAGLVAGVVLVACLSRPVVLGYLVVGLVPITSGVARGVPVPSLRISEIIVVGAAALVFTRTAGDHDRRLQWLDWVAVAFVLLHVGLGVFGGVVNSELTERGVQLLLGPLQFFLLFRIVRATLQTREERRTGLEVLLVATIPVSLLALAQYVGVPGAQSFIEQLTQSGAFDLWGYEQSRRATGPFEAWHPLAGYLFLPIAVTVTLFAIGDRSVLSRWLRFAVVASAALALLVSQTLNVLAGLLIVVVIVGLLTKGLLRVLVPIILVGLIGAVAFGPVLVSRLEAQGITGTSSEAGGAPQTIDYRMEIWTDQYLPAIAEYWTTGFGPELPPSIEWRSTESLYFTLLLRGGVVLLCSFILLMGAATGASWRQRSSPEPARRAAAITIIASTVALVPMHAVFPYFTASGMPQVWWILLAIVAGSSSSTMRQGDST